MSNTKNTCIQNCLIILQFLPLRSYPIIFTHVIIELEMSHAKRGDIKQDEDGRSCIALTLFQHMCTIFIIFKLEQKSKM